MGEVTYVAGHPTFHVNVIMRDYMDRWVPSPTWGPPPPSKQAVKGGSGLLSNVFFCCNKFQKLLSISVKSYYYHPFTPTYYTRGGERGYKYVKKAINVEVAPPLATALVATVKYLLVD